MPTNQVFSLDTPPDRGLYNQNQIPVKSKEHFWSSGVGAIYLWKVRLFWPFFLMHMMKRGAEMENDIW